MPRSSLSIVLAVLLDLFTVAAVIYLLHASLIPRDAGAAALGALIGARARWLTDSPSGPPGPSNTITTAGRESARGGPGDTMREVLEGSALGVLFWPAFRLGGIR